jgi:hypothetical protein
LVIRYRYSGVKWTWYRLGVAAEPRIPPLSSTSEWSHVTLIQLTNVSLQDAGAYVCTAMLIDDGMGGELARPLTYFVIEVIGS